MAFFPASLDNLVDRFASLPGIGRKSAQRLAFHILALPEAEARAFAEAILEAMPEFGRKIKGFDRPDAVMSAVESRTSSPIRIPRDPETLECLQVPGLYPCGEGAGYSGGIVSSALDGIRCAQAIASKA